MAKLKSVIRIDSGLIEYMWEDENGFLRGDGYATRFGVFTYLNSDGTLRKELRHPTDVLKIDSMHSMKMLPLTNNHPTELVNSDNATKYQVGYTGENVRPDGEHILTPIVVTDSNAIKEVYNGKHQLSLGYTVDLVEEVGEFDGIHYDYRQTNIRYNHLALVGQGRAGGEAKLKFDNIEEFAVMDEKRDSKKFEIGKRPKENKSDNDSMNNKNNEFPNRRNDMQKILIRGINYDAAPEVANELTSVTSERDTLKNDNVELQKQNGTLTNTVDEQKKKIDELKGKLDAEVKKDRTDEINKAVIQRQRILDLATSILDTKHHEDLQTKTDSEIVNEILVNEFPNEDFTKRDSAYLMARIDGLEKTKTNKAVGGQRKIVNPKKKIKNDNSHLDSEELAEKARNDMMRGMVEQSEDKEDSE